MAKHKRHERTNGAFGEQPATTPEAPEAPTEPALPAALASLAVDATKPKPEPRGTLWLETVTNSDEIGRREKRLDEAEVDAIAPRIKLLNQDRPFPRHLIEGVVKHVAGWQVLTQTRPFYVKAR